MLCRRSIAGSTDRRARPARDPILRPNRATGPCIRQVSPASTSFPASGPPQTFPRSRTHGTANPVSSRRYNLLAFVLAEPVMKMSANVLGEIHPLRRYWNCFVRSFRRIRCGQSSGGSCWPATEVRLDAERRQRDVLGIGPRVTRTR